MAALAIVLDREYNLHAPTCLFSSFLVQVFIEYILKANKLILGETLVSVSTCSRAAAVGGGWRLCWDNDDPDCCWKPGDF